MTDPYIDATPRLNLPYLAAGQAHKHLTLNEAMARLDALVAASAESRTVAVQPSAPVDGALFLLPAGASGPDWAGRAAGTLMRRDGEAWVVAPVPDGQIVHVRDEGRLLIRHAGGWTPLEALARELVAVTRLGVGATADAANPLTAKLNGALFTARGEAEGGDGSLRLALNKETAADTLSLLFQTGYGARAELGLLGDDRLVLKVSADGAVWTQAFAVDPVTGSVSFTRGTTRSALQVFTADGTYTPPAWARRIEITAVGGGGGGGAGASGSAAANRYGGGGAGSGGVAHERFDRADLGETLSVTVGAGGAGGAGALNAVGGGGQAGGASAVSDGASTLLSAAGGLPGSGGTTAGGGSGPAVAGWPVSGTAGGISTVTAPGLPGGSSARFAGGGGGGGALDTAGAQRAGGAGGWGYTQGGGSRRAAGGVGGAAGGAGGAGASKGWTEGAGAGGGGGGANATGADGLAGGAGGAPGGGGGGGGACRETGLGGAGGAGARGEVWILAFG